MIEAAEKLVERIGSYELLNNIIPGAVYVVLTEKLTSFRILTDSIWSNLILFYFSGLIIGRTGSLVVEKFMRQRKWLNYSSYSEYIKAEQKNEFVRNTSTINNMYRTYTSVALCLLLTVGFGFLWEIIKGYGFSRPIIALLGCVIMLLVFAFSYVKQTRHVVNRIEAINKKD